MIIRRFDCFSIWRRRIAKKRRAEVIANLRLIARRYKPEYSWAGGDEKLSRAYNTAADILEKIADKYEQSGQDC